MRVFAGLLVLTVAGLFASSANAASTDAAVVISNQTAWDLHELYISSVDDQEWGPDQLGAQVIGQGERFTLHGIPCDAYDVMLVDEDGDQCVVSGVALCAERDAWVIRNSDLLACQAESE
jgi:hypothetical protein